MDPFALFQFSREWYGAILFPEHIVPEVRLTLFRPQQGGNFAQKMANRCCSGLLRPDNNQPWRRRDIPCYVAPFVVRDEASPICVSSMGIQASSCKKLNLMYKAINVHDRISAKHRFPTMIIAAFVVLIIIWQWWLAKQYQSYNAEKNHYGPQLKRVRKDGTRSHYTQALEIGKLSLGFSLWLVVVQHVSTNTRLYLWEFVFVL